MIVQAIRYAILHSVFNTSILLYINLTLAHSPFSALIMAHFSLGITSLFINNHVLFYLAALCSRPAVFLLQP